MAARGMRINSRTPPVRIAAHHMVALAALPAEHAGLLLRWGMARYAGGPDITVAAARAEAEMDQRSWSILVQTARGLLDERALSAGFVVILPFEEARAELARVSASRVRQRRQLPAVVNGPAQRADVRTPTPEVATPRGDGDDLQPRRRQAPSPPPEAGPWDQVATALGARNASPPEIAEAIASWRRSHVASDVLAAISMLDGRRIARPVRYLDRMLANDLSERRLAMPNQIRIANPGPLLPRPVRRRIKVAPRAGWTFEGWTARGHPEGGATVEARRQVWRNDSGGLSYKRPDTIDDVPSYDEDPGVYEAD